MTVAAITITYNRLVLTMQTIDSFYKKTTVDRHVFVDNGSTDGTQKYLKTNFDHILLEKNYGITEAFIMAATQLKEYDFILKLDNDIETVTEGIIENMLRFYELNGLNYVCSPADLNLDKHYKPKSYGVTWLNGYKVNFTTHTGGAFQMIPQEICQKLCEDFNHFKQGDQAIGRFYFNNGYRPCYLMDLQIRHIGLNQTSANYVL